MKATKEILGLPLMCIAEGTQPGVVSNIIVDPADKTAKYLIIDNSKGCFAFKVLPFEKIKGIGKDLITAASVNDLIDLPQCEEALRIAYTTADMLDIQACSNSGEILGNISEIVFETPGGKIAECQIADGGTINGETLITLSKAYVFVAADAALAKEIMATARVKEPEPVQEAVAEETAPLEADAASAEEEAPVTEEAPAIEEPSAVEETPAAEEASVTVEQTVMSAPVLEETAEPAVEPTAEPAVEPTAEAKPEKAPKNELPFIRRKQKDANNKRIDTKEFLEQKIKENEAHQKDIQKQIETPPAPGKEKKSSKDVDLFTKLQNQYLLGRTVTKTVLDNNGEILAQRGEVVSDELIAAMKKANKLMDLTLNVE